MAALAFTVRQPKHNGCAPTLLVADDLSQPGTLQGVVKTCLVFEVRDPAASTVDALLDGSAEATITTPAPTFRSCNEIDVQSPPGVVRTVTITSASGDDDLQIQGCGGGGKGQVSPVFEGGVLTFRLKKLGDRAWTRTFTITWSTSSGAPASRTCTVQVKNIRTQRALDDPEAEAVRLLLGHLEGIIASVEKHGHTMENHPAVKVALEQLKEKVGEFRLNIQRLVADLQAAVFRGLGGEQGSLRELLCGLHDALFDAPELQQRVSLALEQCDAVLEEPISGGGGGAAAGSVVREAGPQAAAPAAAAREPRGHHSERRGARAHDE
jgi:hypothetical protein